jgi:hypothetical protein
MAAFLTLAVESSNFIHSSIFRGPQMAKKVIGASVVSSETSGFTLLSLYLPRCHLLIHIFIFTLEFLLD